VLSAFHTGVPLTSQPTTNGTRGRVCPNGVSARVACASCARAVGISGVKRAAAVRAPCALMLNGTIVNLGLLLTTGA